MNPPPAVIFDCCTSFVRVYFVKTPKTFIRSRHRQCGIVRLFSFRHDHDFRRTGASCLPLVPRQERETAREMLHHPWHVLEAHAPTTCKERTLGSWRFPRTLQHAVSGDVLQHDACPARDVYTSCSCGRSSVRCPAVT